MISVHSIHNTTYEVTVAGKTTTTHRVTVNPACYEQLTGGRVSPDQRDNRLGVLLVDDLRGRALAAVGSTAGTEHGSRPLLGSLQQLFRSGCRSHHHSIQRATLGTVV